MLEEKSEDQAKPAADEATTIAVIKDALGERVSDVRASQRLTSSASCLVGDGRDRALERLLIEGQTKRRQEKRAEIEEAVKKAETIARALGFSPSATASSRSRRTISAVPAVAFSILRSLSPGANSHERALPAD